MTPEERMGHMATLDGTVAGPWAGVGRDQLVKHPHAGQAFGQPP